ncbi:MAG: metallophosphoesterase [Oscillospiraceae bacterium]|nr:metallophosphoesterase [Oscillospiraceae bacterium]
MKSPIRFCVIADTHYFNCHALGKSTDTQVKTLNESGAIIDAALEKFIAREDCNVLLICGDLTCNGEGESHAGLVEKLRRVHEAGKRVFVITSTHDFEQQINENKRKDGRYVPVTPTQRGEWQATLVTRDELRGIYNEFGFSTALAEFEELSYVQQIAPGLRVLMLNDDGDWHTYCGFSKEHLAWIEEQAQAARDAGDAIIAVTHHPMMPPFFFYHYFSPRDMHGGFETTRDFFADNGIHVVFTGHTHDHNIAHHTSPAGNDFTDINTASLVSYPAPMRFCELADGVLSVRTELVENFDWDFGGLSATEYLKRKFDFIPANVVRAAATDFEEFAALANGFSVRRDKLDGKETLIRYAGRFLQKLTLGGLGTLLLCRHKLPRNARKIKFVDIAPVLLRNLFMGDGNFSREDELYIAVQILAQRADKIIGKKLRGTFVRSLPVFFEKLFFDDGVDDWSADIRV